ncbi:hypothetical protein CAEBREN_25128 [Caenorhabditis brenneri]|uniref:Uncharacterized protein n=1 Tax=Caenorhabditis brenneri TaxID=135651 RepID=G0MGZ3_CAEBE|nr:hypothetical protein CAEBREN_25128 [Caenorhabditis brenneri]
MLSRRNLCYTILIFVFGFSWAVATNETDVPEELKLVFVHTIWRHGDRTQDGHLNNDPVDPSKWIKGGGGYGQLTPEGMGQMFILGTKLRDRYVKTGFLHNFYDSQQYIKTTAHLSELFNTTFTWDNLWQVHDAVMIELIHFPETVLNQTWYSPEFFHNLNELKRPSRAFVAGLYDPPIVNGINVKRAILKTRGGPLINDISSRMRTKATCAKNDAKCDNYHRSLKFYAYSTHDHTVFALLTVLGLESIVAGPEKYGEWPDYASDILVELFHNSTDERACFRILYQKNINATFEVVTHLVKGCKGLPFCDLSVFESKAKEFRPDRPIQELCQILPDVGNQVSTLIKNVV